MNDAQLLREFVTSESETAFRQLVDQHLSLVLGTARRVTGNNALAEEIAQTVFILLARKAPRLGSKTILSGWLYRTTRFVAARAMQSEERRRRREQEAAAMQLDPENDSAWNSLVPDLDDGLSRLSEPDRTALLLRFFEQQSHREVGLALGVSEEAVKKRVTRALGRLQCIFKRRGIEISAGALAAGMSREVTRGAATPGLAAAISEGALGPVTRLVAGADGSLTLAAEVIAAWRWTQIKIGLIGGGVIVALALLLPVMTKAQRRVVMLAPEAVLAVEQTGNSPTPASQSNRGSPMPGTLPELALRAVAVTVLDRASGEPISGARLSSTTQFELRGIKHGLAFTDAKGRAVVMVPQAIPELERMDQLGIGVSASGYAPRQIHWLKPAGNVLSVVSQEYTVRLEPGITLGGTVVDEEGQPLPDLYVEVMASNYRGYSISYDSGRPIYSPDRREEDFSVFYLGSQDAWTAVVTDASGRFSIPHFPSDLHTLILELKAEDGVQRKFGTPSKERLTAEAMPVVSMDELKAGSARLVFARGVTIEGLVLDAEGLPVPLAVVIEATQPGNVTVQSRNYTDQQGRFRLPDRKGPKIILSAMAEGHASVSKVVAVEPGMNEVLLQLPRAMPLRGRVVDPAGEPIAGASLSLVDYVIDGQALEFSAETSSDGRFEWAAAPTNEVAMAIVVPNFGSRVARLAASPGEHVITIRRDDGVIRVTGTVADAESGERVRDIEAKLALPHNARTLTSPNGAFAFELRVKDFPPGQAPIWSVSVSAEGYESSDSRGFYVEEGDQTLQLTLRR